MKVTIDIPDELYRQVKAEAALRGLTVREVTTRLYRRWLREDEGGRAREAPAGRSAREELAAGRNRMEGE